MEFDGRIGRAGNVEHNVVFGAIINKEMDRFASHNDLISMSRKDREWVENFFLERIGGGGAAIKRFSTHLCALSGIESEQWIILLTVCRSDVKSTKNNLVIVEYLVNISKRRAFWSLSEDILKITVLTTNTPYPSRKIRHICACTHQRPRRKHDQYAVSREDQYAVLKIMDDPNITMEEYIMLEEEKARKRGKVFNWETAKYAIACNDQISSEKTLSCEPTVSSLNDEIDFKISFDDSDDEDYTSEKDNDDNEIDTIQSSEGNMYTQDMAPLPPREQRHPFLKYQGLEYIDADIADFEERLDRIHDRDTHRVQFVDFQVVSQEERTMSWRFLHRTPSAPTSRLQIAVLRLCHRMMAHSIAGRSQAPKKAESARQIPDKGDLRDYWIGISSIGDFLGKVPSYTSIRDLILSLCDRIITCNIAEKSQAPEKVTVTDLYYFIGMDVGSINMPYLLVRYLRLFAAGRKSGALISRGQFVARLDEYFGLLMEERLWGLTVTASTVHNKKH
ncbi:hypothetical protein Tco_0087578 [Tanacetum coccineum]